MKRNDIINDPEYGNKAEAFEAFDDIPTNPNLGRTIGDVINYRLRELEHEALQLKQLIVG